MAKASPPPPNFYYLTYDSFTPVTDPHVFSVALTPRFGQRWAAVEVSLKKLEM